MSFCSCEILLMKIYSNLLVFISYISVFSKSPLGYTFPKTIQKLFLNYFENHCRQPKFLQRKCSINSFQSEDFFFSTSVSRYASSNETMRTVEFIMVPLYHDFQEIQRQGFLQQCLFFLIQVFILTMVLVSHIFFQLTLKYFKN